MVKAGVEHPDEAIGIALTQIVCGRVGPVGAFKTVLVIERLPKTCSVKIMRGTINKLVDGEEYRMPATIDDPWSCANSNRL